MIDPFLPHWPRVVAESLRRMAQPPATMRPTLQSVGAGEVIAVATRGFPGEGVDPTPPAFLLPHQVPLWLRVTAALRSFGAAMLVEPVGTGKTWMALAAAREIGPVLVIGPALLRNQWLAAAEGAGTPIAWWSYERLSRGSLPPGNPAFVIIDEAHRLRNPTTRRVRVLAPWLAGRRTLLLSATPIVNHLDDLIVLLRLILPDDALRLDGIPTLGTLAELTHPPTALRRVVIRSGNQRQTYGSTTETLPMAAAEVVRGQRAEAIIHELTAHHGRGTGRLLAAVLLDACASSDAALLQSLRRYRALLRQAQESGSGDRALLRRFAGEQLDQQVLWELIGTDASLPPLPIDDLPRLEKTLERFLPADSGWLAPLRCLVELGPPVVCFTRHRATAAMLRTTFGDGTAWVTGDAAGIGPHRLAREAVLDAFGPSRQGWSLRRAIPHCLIATDVAAEGLDLQGAGRLVHIDLPWTAMRVAQREGRLLRIGQQSEAVEILVRHPPPAIEAALGRIVAVHRKGKLATRWMAGLAPEFTPATEAFPIVRWATFDHEGADGVTEVAQVQILDQHSRRTGVMTLERRADGEWRVNAQGYPRQAAGAQATEKGPPPDDVSALLDTATRHALRVAHHRPGWGPPRLITRIHQLARAAAWQRDAATLTRLDRTLRWCRTAPRLGDRLRMESLAAGPNEAVVAFEAPKCSGHGPFVATVTSLLLYRSRPTPLR